MNKKIKGIVPHEVPSIPNQPAKHIGKTGHSSVGHFKPNSQNMQKLGKK